MRPGGACTACPGFSLSRHRIAHSRPARAMDRAATGDSRPGYSTTAPAGKRDSHSPQRRTDGQSRPGCNPPQATEGQSHAATGRKGTGKPTEPPTAATEPRNAAGGTPILSQPEKPHRAAHSGAQAQAIHSPGQIPPKTPINAPQSRPGRGCYPYTTRRQNAAQGRTEPPTEGKPPGVQKRPERRRPCPALLYHAKALIGQPRSGQIFERFSVIFPGSVPLCL